MEGFTPSLPLLPAISLLKTAFLNTSPRDWNVINRAEAEKRFKADKKTFLAEPQSSRRRALPRVGELSHERSNPEENYPESEGIRFKGGGLASPIFADGRMVSLPIPENDKYPDVTLRFNELGDADDQALGICSITSRRKPSFNTTSENSPRPGHPAVTAQEE